MFFLKVKIEIKNKSPNHKTRTFTLLFYLLNTISLIAFEMA